MERRSFLAGTTAGLTGLVGLTGCSGSGDADSTPTEPIPDPTPDSPALPEGFDEVVNVADRGADVSGDESVVPILESIDADGSLIYFPPGMYRMDGSWVVDTFERFGVVGNEATIVPDPGLGVNLFRFDDRERGVDLRVEGFTFDYTDPRTTGRMLHLKCRDGLLVRDVRANGTVNERPDLVRVDVTDPEGEGLVHRLQLPDGASSGSNVTGCYVGNNSRGQLTFLNCRIEGFPDNGLYADPPSGKIIVDGGYFANCGISNVRVRGNSIVRNAYVRCDGNHREFANMRGIRLTDYEPQDEPEPGIVENCRVDMLDVTHSDGAIELSSQLARGIVRDTRVRVDADEVAAIRAKTPNALFADLEIEPSLHLENVTIAGDAAGREAVRISDREGCVFDQVDIHQTGRDRDGIVFSRSSATVVRDVTIEVPGDAIVLNDSEMETGDVEIVDTEGQQYGSRSEPHSPL